MKTHCLSPVAKRLGMWAGLLLVSAIVARAVPVTFQVNMAVQTTLGNFNPAAHAVEVHGSFDNWGPGVLLSASLADPSVYEATVEITGTTGNSVQFKFVINQSGTTVWEVDGVGPGGAQNRVFDVPAAAQTLPVVYFNNQATPPGVTAVTFQVNLAVQEAIGNFDPTTHTVQARGAFDNWGTGINLSPSPANTNIYEGTVDITGAVGTVIEHKFVINQAGTLAWEGNVGPAGPNGNRTLTLASTNQILPVVYFNNLTNSTGAGIPVTFQVNMSAQIVLGTFNPSSGIVEVRGPFHDNWGAGLVLTNSATNTNLFAGTFNVGSLSPGSSVPYKFAINGGATWEAGDNRTFTLASPSQTLPPVYFDNVTNVVGALTVTSIAFDEITVSWTANSFVRLQSTTNLANLVWEDVPNTAGAGSATVPMTPARIFFRLIGP